MKKEKGEDTERKDTSGTENEILRETSRTTRVSTKSNQALEHRSNSRISVYVVIGTQDRRLVCVDM